MELGLSMAGRQANFPIAGALVVIAMLFAGGALAQGTNGGDATGSDARAGRFTMTPADDGALRLDTLTGAVSHCRKKDTGWACKLVADDRTTLMEELARLESENSELRLKVAELDKSGGDGDTLGLPSEGEIDRVMTFFESMMRRFFDFARSMGETFQKDET